jgi:hypothetical protein
MPFFSRHAGAAAASAQHVTKWTSSLSARTHDRPPPLPGVSVSPTEGTEHGGFRQGFATANHCSPLPPPPPPQDSPVHCSFLSPPQPPPNPAPRPATSSREQSRAPAARHRPFASAQFTATEQPLSSGASLRLAQSGDAAEEEEGEDKDEEGGAGADDRSAGQASSWQEAELHWRTTD